MKRTALVFGAIGGVLVAVLRLVEYRFLVVEHSLQIYGGLVAAVFAGVGLWLGITIAGRRQAAGKEFRRPGPPSFVVLTFGLASGAVMSLLMLATLPFQDAIGFENGALVGCTGWSSPSSSSTSASARTATARVAGRSGSAAVWPSAC